MPRLSDLPQPYMVVVMLPLEGPATESTTRTIKVDGRVAKLIAWLLDHRPQVEGLRTGHVLFDFGQQSFQAEVKERFPHEGAVAEPVRPPNVGGGRA